MKERRSGAMVGFTIGFIAGLYSTSEDVRHWSHSIRNKIRESSLFPIRKRDILELDDEYVDFSEEIYLKKGILNSIGLKIKNRLASSWRAKKIKTRKKTKWKK